MTWAKLDDGFHSNPKVRGAFATEPAAIGLYALAVSYAAGYETNGKVPPWFTESAIPRARERERAIEALIVAGLWTENGEGWVIHDFLVYNPSREQLEAKRARDRDRKSEGNP